MTETELKKTVQRLIVVTLLVGVWRAVKAVVILGLLIAGPAVGASALDEIAALQRQVARLERSQSALTGAVQAREDKVGRLPPKSLPPN